MRLLNHFATAALLLAAVRANAQQPATPDFKRLEFLVGHCWIGTFPDGKQTDEHCFEWMFDRKFIRDRHVVRNAPGPYQGETIYSWDIKTQRPVYSYFSSEGLVLQGSVEYSADAIRFPSHYDTPTGTVQILAVWTVVDANTYRVSQSQLSGAEWRPLFSMDMKRR